MKPRAIVWFSVSVAPCPAMIAAAFSTASPSSVHRIGSVGASLHRRTRPPPRSTQFPTSLPTPLFASDVDDDMAPHFTSPSTLDWLRIMADSYHLEKGEDLLDVLLREDSNIAVVGDMSDLDIDSDDYLLTLAAVCAKTNLPMASHDFLRADEAIFCYGNMAFLEGFGYDWDEFVDLPSRKCVCTDEDVEERQRLLDAVMEQAGNDAEDSENNDNLIRVRKDGKKILFRGVNLWNVYDTTTCFEDVAEDADFDSFQSMINDGKVKAVGQAVWVKHVDYLD